MSATIIGAAKQGNVDAQRVLGEMYSFGNGVSKDEAIAASWYHKAAEQGDAEAQHRLAWLYYWGRGVQRDAVTSASWYRKAAEQGYSEAALHLGWMYEKGRGVPFEEHLKIALFWYCKAAELGNAEAQRRLGMMYEMGRGVHKDPAIAAGWYGRATDQGDDLAQHHLGRLHYLGLGVPQDIAIGARLHQKMAEKAYKPDFDPEHPDFLKIKASEAANWYRRATELGDADAQYYLGWMYHSGEGVQENPSIAAIWYRKAAEQGQALAQCELGWMYKTGRGVDTDFNLSEFWYAKAEEQGEKRSEDDGLDEYVWHIKDEEDVISAFSTHSSSSYLYEFDERYSQIAYWYSRGYGSLGRPNPYREQYTGNDQGFKIENQLNQALHEKLSEEFSFDFIDIGEEDAMGNE